MKKTKMMSEVAFFCFLLCAAVCCAEQTSSDAETAKRIENLKQEIKSAKDPVVLEKKSAEFVDVCENSQQGSPCFLFLEKLSKEKAFTNNPIPLYYQALIRQQQLDRLEKNQQWEELFDNKDMYRTQVETALASAKKVVQPNNVLAVKIAMLEWQLNKNDESASLVALENLYNVASDFAAHKGDVAFVKESADALAKEKQTTYAKKLYHVYVSHIADATTEPAQLRAIADEFIKEKRVDQAVFLDTAYMDKMIESGKEKTGLVKIITDLADLYRHTGTQQGVDPFFAEKVYSRLEFLYGNTVFDAATLYKRAYNLERIKEYEQCFNVYRALANVPGYTQKDRVYFRLGVLSAYVFGNPAQAQGYFSKVVTDFPSSVDYDNSVYHAALLDQWQGNKEKAKQGYEKIIEKTKTLTPVPEIGALAQQRLKEIAGNQDIDYNLRMFLNAALKRSTEQKVVHVQLFAKEARDGVGQTVAFEANSYMLETGCLQENFSYLWSGQIGSAQTLPNSAKFATSYNEAGTKVVNVALIGPHGLAEAAMEITDITPSAETASP